MRNIGEGYHKKGGQNHWPPSSERPGGPQGSRGPIQRQPRVGIAPRPRFNGVTPESDADLKRHEYPPREELLDKLHSRVQVFLYLLMRDSAPTGSVSQVIQNVVDDTQSVPPQLSNQELAAMAERYADKLLSGI